MSDPFHALKQEVLMEGSDYHIVEVTLATADLVPEHRHTYAEEICYCLEGQLEVLIDGTSVGIITTGQRKRIPAGRAHRIAIAGGETCRYLAIHGGGKFDFVAV
jgi:quercetin dioxygenase-like cupin family protein